ncbi:MAG TPA: hypothetical protein VL727_07370 [Puia sp.]|nr:hypothetical protein [Puia sp.]
MHSFCWGRAGLNIFLNDPGHYGCIFSKARADCKTQTIHATSRRKLDNDKYHNDQEDGFTSLKKLIIDIDYQDASAYAPHMLPGTRNDQVNQIFTECIGNHIVDSTYIMHLPEAMPAVYGNNWLTVYVPTTPTKAIIRTVWRVAWLLGLMTALLCRITLDFHNGQPPSQKHYYNLA